MERRLHKLNETFLQYRRLIRDKRHFSSLFLFEKIDPLGNF